MLATSLATSLNVSVQYCCWLLCLLTFGLLLPLLLMMIMMTMTMSCLQVHRLVVVDEHEVVKGIVSLSDILQALVLTDEHCGRCSTSHTINVRVREINPSFCLQPRPDEWTD